MSLIVHNVAVLDRFHHNGDPFWDGDQTLYELDVSDRTERDSVLVVVPRGDAFISEETVAAHIERLEPTLASLRSRARKPDPTHRPQIALTIECEAAQVD